ncbi:hypothetical protein BD560DRAFT_373652 [Blakeslea trispora]|nr:hypothetical protein BD560DRAFT_373652 [Blakeslea trispora]
MTTAFFQNSMFFPPISQSDTDFQKQEEPKEETNNYFIDFDLPITDRLETNEDWSYVLSEMRQQIFNSSTASYTSPETHIIRKAHRQNPVLADELVASARSNALHDLAAPNIVRSSDPLTYRRHRSENLLLRMIHCRKLDLSQISLMRLSKGVFVHQKWQSSISHPSPTLSAIEETLNLLNDTGDEAPIDTFQFSTDFFKSNLTSSCFDMFVPYSYTFGARYTNPYSGAHDLVIRGKLPLWCQTLFLSTCLKQSEPIQPHVPQFGLFPFVPQVAVVFKPWNEEDYADLVTLDLALTYELFTLEHYDPLLGVDQHDFDHQWSVKKKEILQNVLVCDIPDDLAAFLSNMAATWAVDQGLMI